MEVHAFRDVPWDFAKAEGEGFRSVEDWRARHRAYFAERGIVVDDDTPFVCVWFECLGG